MCLCATDEEVEARWGAGYIERTYGKHGVTSIWHSWGDNILPCPVYLRHCVLAAEKQVRRIRLFTERLKPLLALCASAVEGLIPLLVDW